MIMKSRPEIAKSNGYSKLRL